MHIFVSNPSRVNSIRCVNIFSPPPFLPLLLQTTQQLIQENSSKNNSNSNNGSSSNQQAADPWAAITTGEYRYFVLHFFFHIV